MAESKGEISHFINITIKTPKDNKVIHVDSNATVDQVYISFLCFK